MATVTIEGDVFVPVGEQTKGVHLDDTVTFEWGGNDIVLIALGVEEDGGILVINSNTGRAGMLPLGKMVKITCPHNK